jgi:hypothetical protein
MANGNNITPQANTAPGIAVLGSPGAQLPTALAPTTIPPAATQAAPPAMQRPGLRQRMGRDIRGAARSLYRSMNAEQSVPRINPKTGQMEEVNVGRRRPGAFFRDILAASILGGAAGMEQHQRNIWGGGFQAEIAGAETERQFLGGQRQQQIQQAQQEFQRGMELSREKREETLVQANIAHLNQEMIQGMYNRANQDLKIQQMATEGNRPIYDLLVNKLQMSGQIVSTAEAKKMAGDAHKKLFIDLGPNLSTWKDDPNVLNPDGSRGSVSFDNNIGVIDIDPNKPIPFNTPEGQAIIDKLEKSGVDKDFEGLTNTLKGYAANNKSITWDQFNTILLHTEQAEEKNSGKRIRDLAEQEEQAKLATEKSRLETERLSQLLRNLEIDVEKGTRKEQLQKQAQLDLLKKWSSDVMTLERQGVPTDEAQKRVADTLTVSDAVDLAGTFEERMDAINDQLSHISFPKDADPKDPAVAKQMDIVDSLQRERDSYQQRLGLLRGKVQAAAPPPEDIAALQAQIPIEEWDSLKPGQEWLYNPRGGVPVKADTKEKAEAAIKAGYKRIPPRGTTELMKEFHPGERAGYTAMLTPEGKIEQVPIKDVQWYINNKKYQKIPVEAAAEAIPPSQRPGAISTARTVLPTVAGAILP